jgi:hypothetical protein
VDFLFNGAIASSSMDPIHQPDRARIIPPIANSPRLDGILRFAGNIMIGLVRLEERPQAIEVSLCHGCKACLSGMLRRSISERVEDAEASRADGSNVGVDEEQNRFGVPECEENCGARKKT